MQKVINVLAVVSFAVSAGIVGAGVYVYQNQDEIKEDIKRQVADGVKESLGGALGGGLFGGGSSSPVESPVEGAAPSGALPIPTLPF